VPSAIFVVEYVESEKKKCYHEIVMAVPNLRNAAKDTKKPQKTTRFTALTAQLT
jgi:hypothetical protein